MFTDSQINKARQTIREQNDLHEAAQLTAFKRNPYALERFMNRHGWFWNGTWWIKIGTCSNSNSESSVSKQK